MDKIRTKPDRYRSLAEVTHSDEKWREYKPLPRYLISNHGRVYDSKWGKIMPRFVCNNNGYITKNKDRAKPTYLYLKVCLTDPTRHKSVNAKMIHRLVAETWLPKPANANKNQCNHKDMDTFNNHVENLEYVTKRMNRAVLTERLVWSYLVRVKNSDRSRASARRISKEMFGHYHYFYNMQKPNIWVDVKEKFVKKYEN